MFYNNVQKQILKMLSNAGPTSASHLPYIHQYSSVLITMGITAENYNGFQNCLERHSLFVVFRNYKINAVELVWMKGKFLLIFKWLYILFTGILLRSIIFGTGAI
jgi:hypothetical protein